jgi:UDP-N-acetylmuramoylalanine--D-glutamate ligase
VVTGAEFQGKQIAMLGWGVDTEDVVPFLLESGAGITIYDRKESLETKYKEDTRLEWKLGQEEWGDLSKYDYILRNPSVYRYRKEITAAEKAGVKVTSKTKIFFDHCPGKIIGVTGTKGKGTTSTLAYEMLKAAGKKVFLAGNIGKGAFEFWDQLDTDSWMILELSSFQLIDLTKSPHIAVVLMITRDHLDWHKDEQEYIQAKANMVSHQTENDYAVINRDYENSRKIGEQAGGQKIWISGKDLGIVPEEIRLRGEHNRENIVAAMTAAKLAGVEEKVCRQVVKEFKGLEHRLEETATVKGVTYFDDSFSTVPETTIAAIKAFYEPVILIAGGSEKGSDFTQMGEEIVKAKNIKAVILIGMMTDRIEEAIKQAGGGKKIIRGGKGMPEIVAMAAAEAQQGDVVVLSPAAASFDMFKNYKDRGNQFKTEVIKLQGGQN